MARCVHRFSAAVPVALLAAIAAAACVVPPPLSLDEPDAGLNNPPVIRGVRDGTGQPQVRPGPLTFVVGQGELLVTAADTDLGDTLYVRMYLDYGINNRFENFRVQCEAAPGTMPSVERTITCPLLGLCTDDLIDTGDQHIFEIDVFDRLPISVPGRLFRGVTPPGEIATFWWNLECIAP